MPRSFMQRKRKRREIRKATEEGEPSSQESSKVSRFYGLIDGVTIKVLCSPSKQPYNLGCFQISSFRNEIQLPTEISMKLDPDGACFILLQESTDSVITVYEGIHKGLPYEILQLLTSLNIFYFYLHSSKLDKEFDVEIYFDSSKFITLDAPSVPVYSRHKSKMVEILQFFLDINLEVYDGENTCEGNEIPRIYSCIQNSYNPETSFEFSHEAFKPQLRPYQCQAVSWMLEREKGNFSVNDLHPLYIPISLKDGHILYFHKLGGFIVNKKYASDSPCRGGLLADEMGLGKTLEVLACILMNPRPGMERENSNVNSQEIPQNGILSNNSLNIEQKEKDQENLAEIFGCRCGKISSCDWIAKCVKCKITQHPRCMFHIPKDNEDYVCPHCLVKEPTVSSRATLIVSPSSILLQWMKEITKHIKEESLKVFWYQGVRTQKYVHQQLLADFDVVLVSYETLQKEIVHLDTECGRDGHSLRNSKRFLSIPSPLSIVEWWRICLDEAQMFESGHLKLAMMLGQLNSINRWCVTGTPVKRGVDDIFSLFYLLDSKPFNEKMWFKEGIKKPFKHGNHQPLSSSLQSIAWCTKKYQVFDQIGLREVKEVTEKLKFSPVEKFYYENNYSKCIRAFMENLEDSTHVLDMELPRISKILLHKIISPLKDLLRTCCHFQIGHESLDSKLQNPMMSPSELLTKLLKSKTYECEQIYRQYIMASNALAGVYLIEEDYIKAVEIYKKCLQSIEDNKKYIRTDVTQQIHNLFHLSNTLKSAEKEGKVIECELKPSELDERVKVLSESCLEKSRMELSSCTKDYTKVKNSIQEEFNKLKLRKTPFPISSWWCALNELSENQRNVFLDKLPEILEKASSGSSFIRDVDFQRSLQRNVPAFLSLILRWSAELHGDRKDLLDIMDDIAQEPDDLTVQSAIYCHLRPVTGSPQCKFCKADDLFKSYESKLYVIEETTTIKPLEDNTTEEIVTRNRKHHAGPLEICLEYIFRSLVTAFKDSKQNREFHEDVANDGYCELRLMITLKKEYQVLLAMWRKYYDFVSEKDQIEMAKISMKLIPENEYRPDSIASYCLYPHEVNLKKIQFQSDATVFQSRLRTKFGQFHYLKNLEKLENKNGPFEEFCPICRTKIETTWYVLQCGHCLCVTCTQQLLDVRNIGDRFLQTCCRGINCPYCREFSPTPSLNIIGARKEEENDEIPLKKFYSTKLNAVVRCLLRIKKEERGAKSLVFSSFPAILQMLGDALAENGITFVKLSKGLQDSLYDFKQKNINALLIPLNDGYSGLNITEAHHVLLVEPVIDSPLQLQAIGRAHRFGQKKQVTVHRFIIMNTVEQAIHAATSTSKDGETVLKLIDLKNLFNK